MAKVFDLVALVLLALLCLNGIRKGITEELMKLVGVVVAIYVTLNYHYLGTTVLLKFWEIPPQYHALLGFAVVFMAMIILMQLLTMFLKYLIKSLSLGGLDRFGGMLFGGLKALVLLAVILWVIQLMPPKWTGNWHVESKTFPMVSGFQQGLVTLLNLDEEVAAIQAKIAGIINKPTNLSLPGTDSLPFEIPDSTLSKFVE
ncbi:MAG: CvpA family protein [Candidatus Marinimicrobia bacterium]|nr:CvpA family protein [Candidatus Neomarinimicrobiota bacterium]MCF7840704.1 CvpA family protein [Candidatus Neomarinimicrobiota bacterium]MCF7903496.1 CvpA family protein [Candidatus Neomarinimicrobiota bacterium]